MKQHLLFLAYVFLISGLQVHATLPKAISCNYNHPHNLSGSIATNPAFKNTILPVPNDFGVAGISTPTLGGQAGSYIALVVTIKNYGTAVQNSANIVTAVNGAIVNVYSWTGFLNPGITTPVTLNTILVPAGNFTLCVYTELPGDTDHSNDTACVNLYGFTTKQLPYSDNFEGPNDWLAKNYSGFSTWERGTPNYGTTSGSYSPVNAWDIDLFSGYASNSLCYLYSPYFDFTGAVFPKLNFWQNYTTEQYSDGVTLQYSVNNGLSWQTIGSANDTNGLNWYNSAGLNGGGIPGWSGISSGWKESSYDLSQIPALANQPGVQFRYNFVSNGFTEYDGHSIDDFNITIADSIDVGLTVFINPLSISVAGVPDSVIVTLKNFGILPQTNIDIYYQIGGNPVMGPYTWTGTIFSGQQINVKLPINFTPPVGYYNLCAWTVLAGDAISENDTTCLVSLGKAIFSINSSGFTENFENGNLGWHDSSFSIGTSWQLGTPAWHKITSAFSPFNAWMTNINSGYLDNAECALISPFFDFSQTDSIKLSFWHRFYNEGSYDGTRLEYSIDTGITWSIIGAMGDPAGVNWYNISQLNSSNYPAWTDSSTNPISFQSNSQVSVWILSSYKLQAISNLNYQPNPVLFRFVFTSDGSVNAVTHAYSGHAIDNFSLQLPCNTDLSLISILSPNSGPAGTTLIPKITVKNEGLGAISNFSINYCITPLSSGITTCLTYNWTGVLPPAAVVTVFLPPLIMPTGQFDFCVWVNLLNDCLHDNDSICIQRTGIPVYVISNANFVDSYDASDMGWTAANAVSGNQFTNWELGTPNFGGTIGAHSTPDAWDINLYTGYTSSAYSILYSPFFSLTNTIKDSIAFWYNSNTLLDDGVRVEYALNNTGNWTLLGFFNDPSGVNWYNSPILGSSSFSGWSGSSNGWKRTSYSLAFLGNQALVRFRIIFTSYNSPYNGGFSIDDFSVYQVFQKDASVQFVNNLPANITTANLIDLKINLHNSGITPTTPIDIYYSVNNGAFINTTWPSVIAPDSSKFISLTQFNPLPGPNHFRIYISMGGDLNRYNDTLDFSFNAILSTIPPYTTGFENANSGWSAVPSSIGATNWEWGSPTFGATNTVHGGNFCWDVNLTTPYGNVAYTKLFSPFFDYSNISPSELRCWINFNTEYGADGTQLLYTLNGINFQPLGIYNDPNGVNWFNTGIVTALNGSGWSGTSFGWQETVYNTSAFYGNPSVQFRFDFKSDLSLSGDGFSLDDFVINGTVGVDEQDETTSILVYPNPANDQLNIIFDRGIVSQASISLIDVAGAEVLNQNLFVDNRKSTIDLKNLNEGIYILKVNCKANIYYRKITKIK